MRSPSLWPWMGLALLAHGVAFAASDRPIAAGAPSAPPLEVELAPAIEPDPPPPVAAPETPEEERSSEAPPAARPPHPAALQPRAAPPANAAAKVGALLTSGETADNDDPVAFLSDPDGVAYGSGVVAREGKLDRGAGPTLAASTSAPPTTPAPAERVMPTSHLSRAPSLDEPDACRGFFPTDAAVDVAKVDLVVVVEAQGRVTSATIARESPAGEGFGKAARACLLAKRFRPGADRDGRPVAASAAVRVHFTR